MPVTLKTGTARLTPQHTDPWVSTRFQECFLEGIAVFCRRDQEADGFLRLINDLQVPLGMWSVEW